MHVGADGCQACERPKYPKFMGEFDGSYEDAWIFLENLKKELKCPEGCEYELIGTWTVKCQLVKIVDKAMRDGKSALEIVKLVTDKKTCDCYKTKNGCFEEKQNK